MNKNRWLYLPIELKVRELEARILMACTASENGYRVVLGHKNEIQTNLSIMPQGIFLTYGMAENLLPILENATNFGHRIIAQDEEGLVVWQHGRYQKYRISNKTLNLIQYVFTWGDNQKQLISETFPEYSTKIITTGSPRIDLLREPYNKVFDDRVEKIKKTYGPFILVNTNFGLVNNFKGMTDYYEHIKKAYNLSTDYDEAFHKSRFEFQNQLNGYFIEMIKALSNSFSKMKIIVRPHPAENHDTNRKIFHDFKNVVIHHEGCVIPWLKASEVMIHNGCTTGVEAVILNKAAVTYRPIKNDLIETFLPSFVSHEAFTLSDLVSIVASYLDGKQIFDDKKNSKEMNYYIANLRNSNAVDKIIDLLDGIKIDNNGSRTKQFFEYLEKQKYTNYDNSDFLSGANDISSQYVRHKFSGLSKVEVNYLLSKFQTISGRFQDVSAKQIGPSMYLFESKKNRLSLIKLAKRLLCKFTSIFPDLKKIKPTDPYINKETNSLNSIQCPENLDKTFPRNLPQATLISEISLGNQGGSQLFIGDINNDGIKEFIWLQSAGIFKSDLFAQNDHFNERLDPGFNQHLFCLTATDQNNRLLWQVGAPYTQSSPSFISHACEQMVSIADIDADGQNEVIVLDSSNNLLILEGLNGKVKASIKLPADNFSIVKTSTKEGTRQGNRILIGNSDKPYSPYEYGNPWLFFNGNLELIHQGEYIGAGHNAVVFDANADGADEFLIGYQLVDTHGRVIWTVDAWKNNLMDNPTEQHVDDVSIFMENGDWKAAIAGSDKLYLINSNGRSEWTKKLPHPQYVVILGEGESTRIIVLNQRETMNCFDINGKILWEKLFPEHWPLHRPPSSFTARPIHMNHPAAIIRGTSVAPEMFLYMEGGWPYGIDQHGEPAMLFPATKNSETSDLRPSLRRINDHGLSFEGDAVDLNDDGMDEVIIYNRRYAWIYKI